MSEKLTANQAWKKSGSTLPFKEWIDRENKKMQQTQDNFIPFDSTVPEVTVDTSTLDTVGNNINVNNPFSNNVLNKNNVLGLNSSILIFSGVIIVASLGYYIYIKVKDKNA